MSSHTKLLVQNPPNQDHSVFEGPSAEQKFEQLTSAFEQLSPSNQPLPNLALEKKEGWFKRLIDWLNEILGFQQNPLLDANQIDNIGAITWFCVKLAAFLLVVYLIYLLIRGIRFSRKVQLKAEPKPLASKPSVPIATQLELALKAGDQWGHAMRLRWVVFLEKKQQAAHQTLLESVPLGLMDRTLAQKFVRGMYHPEFNEKSVYDEFDHYLNKASYQNKEAA